MGTRVSPEKEEAWFEKGKKSGQKTYRVIVGKGEQRGEGEHGCQ